MAPADALKAFLAQVRHPEQLSVSSLIQRFGTDAKTTEYHLTLAMNRRGK